MRNLTWMARHPKLYKQEREQIESRYPKLKMCSALLDIGHLAYHGEIPVRLSSGTVNKQILLLYPQMFPSTPPVIKPLAKLPESEPHGGLIYQMLSARHQMNDGALCLVEQDPFRERTTIIRGIDILQRAAQWYFSIDSGHNPFDSLEADIQSHILPLGNILLGPEFYSDELQKGGYFYAAQYPGRNEDIFRLVGLAFSSDFEQIVKFKDCRKTLEHSFAWIDGSLWDIASNISGNQQELKEQISSKALIKGYWWSLEKEPTPPRTGLDILKLISDSDTPESFEKSLQIFSPDINVESNLFIGLRFPDRQGGYDWLICCLHLRDSIERNPLLLTYEKKLALFGKAKIYVLFRHSVRQKELMLRNQGRVPKQISERTISLFGVGSVGSTIAELLAKAGVGRLNLFDFDQIQTGNVIRHQSGLEYFGEFKVDTTFWNVRQHNPFVAVSANRVNLLESYQKLDECLSASELVISSTANESLETVINEVAVIRKQPVYYVRAMRGGSAGRIFRVIPGRDACRHCISKYLQDKSSKIGYWLDIPEIEGTLLSHECGNPILAASGTDLTLISSLCTKIVLKEIENSFGSENHWLWTSEPIQEHSELNGSYKLMSRSIPPLVDCPFCSDPPVSSVEIPNDIQNKIERLTVESGQNETGGILIGYFDEGGKAVVVNASDAGPNAECAPSKFLKDVPYTQNWLDNEIQKSAGKIEYIGEWHCHTNSDTTPSITDITSLNGIAESSNYLCQTPVMLILGSDGQGSIVKKTAYSFSQNRPFQIVSYQISED